MEFTTDRYVIESVSVNSYEDCNYQFAKVCCTTPLENRKCQRYFDLTEPSHYRRTLTNHDNKTASCQHLSDCELRNLTTQKQQQCQIGTNWATQWVFRFYGITLILIHSKIRSWSEQLSVEDAECSCKRLCTIYKKVHSFWFETFEKFFEWTL